jgi:peptidoglycan/LPS O-acetylase OafA/YrhL
VSSELPHVVARSADTAELHAPVPTLLLELQTLLGALAATVAAETNRGRRPFRPNAEWPQRLGDLAYGVYLLADQTGVDISQVVANTASRIASNPRPAGRNGTDPPGDFFDRA